jgi:hypothetical protein
MTKAIKSDPSRYSVEEEKLWQIEKTLFSLKGQLLDGRIFQVRVWLNEIISITNLTELYRTRIR